MAVESVSRARSGHVAMDSRRARTRSVSDSTALLPQVALEPDIDPEELTAALEANLLRAGMAAYYAVRDGALALLNHVPLGQRVDARV
jgi:hypothetical protein